ncbi:MAG: YidC/Oxa1 family membrane protein insertase [Tissierellia bacterium]|nr:YidC/Oxa1 family membrane protein insertase [Tissierellia bacterium]
MISFLANILGSLLRSVYGIVSGMGSEPASISFLAISIILTTIIFKVLLLPLNIMQTKSQMKMARLQPKIQALQDKYGNDKQTFAKKQQELFQESGYNPMLGCLPLLIQLPIIIAFYRIFQFPTQFAFTDAAFYDSIQKNFFFIKDLDVADPTGLVLPLIAAGFTWLTSYLTQHNAAQKAMSNPQSQSTMNTMMMMMPVMIFFFSRRMAAGVVLYWIVSNLFTLVQQYISNVIIAKEAQEELS